MKWIWLLAGLLAVAGVVAAEEDMSSAQLVQFAVDKVGDADQEAAVSGFDIADSTQIGYSSDGKVTQTISYNNIGNGSVTQWGESGDMPRTERSMFLDQVGDSGFTWQWGKGDVNQTINVTNSQNLQMNQIIGGLRKILFPDPETPAMSDWWFCGKNVNGTGGMPLCAEKMAKKIFNGKATPRDYYMLEVLEEQYYVFPPENLTPHVILTKWNITRNGENLTVKFKAHNFGRKMYNATLIMDFIPKISIVSLDGKSEPRVDEKLNWEIKAPERRSVVIGRYAVPSMRDIDKEVTVSLNGTNVKNLEMKMISG